MFPAAGSVVFYDHVVSVRLLPLARMVRWTRLAQENLLGGKPKIMFAASFNFNKVRRSIKSAAGPRAHSLQPCPASRVAWKNAGGPCWEGRSHHICSSSHAFQIAVTCIVAAQVAQPASRYFSVRAMQMRCVTPLHSASLRTCAVHAVQILMLDAETGIVKACLSNKRSQVDAVPPLGPGSELTALLSDPHTAPWGVDMAARSTAAVCGWLRNVTTFRQHLVVCAIVHPQQAVNTISVPSIDVCFLPIPSPSGMSGMQYTGASNVSLDPALEQP